MVDRKREKKKASVLHCPLSSLISVMNCIAKTRKKCCPKAALVKVFYV